MKFCGFDGEYLCMKRAGQLVVRCAGTAIASAGLVAAVATPAAAHAVLESTTPADGSVVATAPTQVTLHFGEQVALTPSDIRVYDDQLRRVDQADAGHITNQAATVGVRLISGLADGTYTVTYRVISADSHPVSGGFTFSVGAPSEVQGVPTGLGGGNRAVGIALGTARFVNYVGVVIGIGGLVFFMLWPAGRHDRVARNLTAAGLITLFAGTVAAFFLEVPYAAGTGFGTIFDGQLLSTIANSHYGVALIGRLLTLAVALAVYRRLLREGGWIYGVLVASIALPIADSFAHTGHSAVHDDNGVALLSDATHVLAVSVWLGGLVMLLAVVFRRHSEDVATVLPRFSRTALTCIAIIIGTGTYQALRNVGYWPALTDTAYGRLVLAKISGLVVIVGLGYLARRFVVRHYVVGNRSSWAQGQAVSDGPGTLAVDAPPNPPTALDLTVLQRGLFAEVVTGVVVLGLAAVLVATPQGKTAYAPAVSRTIVTSTFRLNVDVDPARTGPTVIHVYAYTPAGQSLSLKKVTGSLSLPTRSIGPLPVRFSHASPSQVLADTTLEATGNWRLDMVVQTSPIEATTVATEIPVR